MSSTEQAAAIKRMMTNRKRELSTVHRKFPKFTPGVSAAVYAMLYYSENGLGNPFAHSTEEYRRDRYVTVHMPAFLIMSTAPARVLSEPETVTHEVLSGDDNA